MENKILIQIIKDEYGIDISKPCRKAINTVLRAIFAKILRSRGHKLTYISKSIKRHHTSVMYYTENYDAIIHEDARYIAMFNNIYKRFVEQIGAGDMSWLERMSIDELKKEVISLRSKYNDLLLENQSLRIEHMENKSLTPMINIIKQKLKPNTEELVIKKLHFLFNGI